MIVVSDTSPITNLIQIEKIHILKAIFSEIIIPNEVYAELIELDFQKKVLETIDWISTKNATDTALLKQLSKDLDRGEAESIVLAIELNADFLLIDEKKGRKAAREYGIEITGLLGVLRLAKLNGLIENLQVVMDELIFKTGFRIHPKLYEQVLKSVGE